MPRGPTAPPGSRGTGFGKGFKGSRGGGRGGGAPAGLAKSASGHVEGFEIFLKYLPKEATEESLKEFFAEAGEMVGAPRLLRDGSGLCKGVGWITFATEAALSEALSWDGASFGGRRLSITSATQQHTGVRPSLQAPGTHTPAMLAEVVREVVGAEPGGTYIDATFGRGGHSRGILAALSPSGALHAFDMDPEAITAGKALAAADSRFHIHHAPFSSMARELAPLRKKVAGVFLDLGISSPQFDEAGRGFRPEADGPLDLRFDQSAGEPAHAFLQKVDRKELARILHQYGETADAAAARRIADAIVIARDTGTLPTRTQPFAALVAAAKGKEYQAMHPAKLTFQALRVHLNREFDELTKGMRAAFTLLQDGGRIGVLTWKHSECNLVIDVYRALEAARPEAPLRRWYDQKLRDGEGRDGAKPLKAGWALEMDDTLRPSHDELQLNSRSRSALLHVLRKRRAPRMADLEGAAYKLLGWEPDDDAKAAAARRKAKKLKRKREAGE